MITKRVVAAIIEESSRILVARRASGQSHAHKWEFPGGKIEPGETPEASLAREIQEELGMEICVDKFFAANTFSYNDFTIELLAYRAKLIRGEPTLSVHDEVQWATVPSLPSFDFTAADLPFVEKLLAEYLLDISFQTEKNGV